MDDELHDALIDWIEATEDQDNPRVAEVRAGWSQETPHDEVARRIDAAFAEAYELAGLTPPDPPAPRSLESLIAECTSRHWEWRISGEWELSGYNAWTWMVSAAVRLPGWEKNPPESAGEDGWLGLCEGEPAELLEAAMTWAEEEA